MSTTIQEYSIPITSVGTPYAVTLGGNLLKHVRFANNHLAIKIFATVENSGQPHPTYTRYFLIVASGSPVPAQAQYIGTSDSSPSGTFYHAFEMPFGWEPPV